MAWMKRMIRSAVLLQVLLAAMQLAARLVRQAKVDGHVSIGTDSDSSDANALVDRPPRGSIPCAIRQGSLRAKRNGSEWSGQAMSATGSPLPSPNSRKARAETYSTRRSA